MSQYDPRTLGKSGGKSGASLPRRLFGIVALLAILAAVMMACGFGPSSDSSGGPGSGTSASATSTSAPTTAPDATATSTSAPATPTHAVPTATPVPVLKSTIITKALNNIAPGSNSAITDIVCPSGYLVAGGGPNSGYTKFTLMWNAPISASTWRAEVFNDGTSTINVQIQVVCLSLPGLHSQIITKGLGAIAANTNSAITDIACPSGYLVAGGGPNSGYGNFAMMWGAPISSTTWRGEIFNNNASTIYAQLQVVCLAATGLHSQVVTRGLGAIGGNTNSAITDIACPSGYLVAGGGPNSGYSKFTAMSNAPINTTTWRSEVYNNDSSSISVQTQIVCMKH